MLFLGLNSFAQTDEIKREEQGLSYINKHGLFKKQTQILLNNSVSQLIANNITNKLYGFHQIFSVKFSPELNSIIIDYASDLIISEANEIFESFGLNEVTYVANQIRK
jgi:hypothetical protein